MVCRVCLQYMNKHGKRLRMRMKTPGNASMFWSEKGGKGVRSGDSGECCRSVVPFSLSSRPAVVTHRRGRKPTFAGGA